MKHAKKKLKIAAIVASVIIVLLFGGFYIYTLDYYRADDIAVQARSTNTANIQSEGSVFVIYPEKQMDNKTGFIFYPGGKVEATAYVPLLEKISQGGITCVLVSMPFNLAVFDINAADRVIDKLPEIRNWYIGGHSLGGSMASSYVENNSSKINGLILLGSYPINKKDVLTIAIYGSEDQLLDRSKLEGIAHIIELAGGNHAQFGNYGEQKGDGLASISREEQQTQTVNAILKFINDQKQ